MRPSVQQSQDQVGVVGHPQNGSDVVVLGSPDGMEDGSFIEHLVLKVEGDVVEAQGPQQLHGIGGIEAYGSPEHHLAIL